MTMLSERPRYRIKAVSQKTGIPSITIRAWERRYQVLTPNREQNRYRLYSEADVQTLLWLKLQVDSGVQISQAALELKEFTDAGELPAPAEITQVSPKQASTEFPIQETMDRLYQSLKQHDELKATPLFEQAAAALPLVQLFEQFIIPILIRIGEDWYNGKITVATEHFASSFIRARLMVIFQQLPLKKKGPRIVIGSAPEDLHEIGPLMMAILVREAGFVVEFIGPDTPLTDLAEYAVDAKINLIVLSATTVESANLLSGFQKALEKLKHTPVFAFGGSAFSFQPDLVKNTPGVYLGKTLTQSLEKIKALMQTLN